MSCLVGREGGGGKKFGAMKYGKLLQVLLEQMPAEYRDKFLSYKQLKKVINTILQHNSLPAAAFVEAPVAEPAEGLAQGPVEAAVKRAKGEEGDPVAMAPEARDGGDGGSEAAAAAVSVGGKRKAKGSKGKTTVNVEQEALAARHVAVRARGGDEKELTKEEENFLHLLNKELEKFNSFFTEKEEEYVIRLQVRSISFDLRLPNFLTLQNMLIPSVFLGSENSLESTTIMGKFGTKSHIYIYRISILRH